MNQLLCAFALLSTIVLAACGGGQQEPARPRATPAEPAPASTKAPVPEGEVVKLSPEQLAAARLGLDTAGPGLVREVLPLYGAIAPNAERIRDITARYPGVIREVATQVGASVRQGQLLARIESNESLETYPVTSPIAGVVTRRQANPGEQSGDRVLFTVADLSTVWVELAVFPRDVGRIRTGQAVRVRSSDAQQSAEGRIVYVAPFGSSASQTVTARVLLENTARRWAPGLYVTADVVLAEASVPLAVSSDAIQDFEGHATVFVERALTFEARPIKPGRADREITEVLSGLSPGEVYVARNSFVLKAELGKGSAEHE